MTEQLDHIIQKVTQLAEQLNHLRLENAKLTEENHTLRTERDQLNERIGELTERLTQTQQALAGQRGDQDTESSQKLRKQIDQYMSEIDKCIAWLQNA